MPVNYAMYESRIGFRNTPYSELGTHGPRSGAAFGVDHLDYEHPQGRSVVVALGRFEELAPEEVDDLCKAWEPRPWEAGNRNFFMKPCGGNLGSPHGRRLEPVVENSRTRVL